MISHASQMANGTFWNALERFSVLGINLLCTFIMARFLTPADFGLMGMLVVFTLFGNVISESGFSQALIREKEVSDLTMSTVFWANLVVSWLIYLVLYLAAPSIADFYHQPILTKVSRWTFLCIPLTASCLIQISWYTRQLQFRRMCIISFLGSLISILVAIALAWRLQSVWALVIQVVLTYLLRAVFYWMSAQWRPKFSFSWSELGRLFHFSKNLLLTGLIGTLFNNIYMLLIGRYYGATATGYFSQADRARMVISNNFTSVVQNVSYPVLSQIQNEGSDLRSAYRKVILSSLLAVGFIMTLIMCVSEDLFELLMGSAAWRISGQYLLPLGIAGILFPLHAVNQNILLVKGLGRTVLYLEIFRRALMVILIILSLQFRVEVFIWSYALYSFLLIFINLQVCGKPIGYKLGQQLRDILPMLLTFCLMLLAALLSNHTFSALPIWGRLLITSLLCLGLGIGLMSRQEAFHDVIRLIRHRKF